MVQELDREGVLAIIEQAKNWGRWGADDERGTLNLITPEHRRRAAALVSDGVTVSCALPLNTVSSAENPNPVQHMMTRAGDLPNGDVAMDYFSIATHGAAHTHLDALCHIFLDGVMYNGFPASEVRSDGAHRNAITSAEQGVVSRGVLLDIPALRGLEYLEPGEAIHPDDLDAAEARQRVHVEPGDILLVRTGRHLRRQKVGPGNGLAGLHADCIPWLRARDVAVLGCDGISDLGPSGVRGFRLPVHFGAIYAMGLHLIDNAQLDDLSAACAARGRYEFLLTLAPLRLERGTGCPINPIAMF